MSTSRRELLAGAIAAAIPTAFQSTYAGDGVALTSAAHPVGLPANEADIPEAALETVEVETEEFTTAPLIVRELWWVHQQDWRGLFGTPGS